MTTYTVSSIVETTNTIHEIHCGGANFAAPLYYYYYKKLVI